MLHMNQLLRLSIPRGTTVRLSLVSRQRLHKLRSSASLCANYYHLPYKQKQSFLSSQEKPKQNHKTSDPPVLTWVERFTPNSLLPYARLARIDKPIGTLLLLWPSYWGIAVATSPSSLPDPSLLALFGLGAFVMRGAGCTINDMWDRDLDRRVTRTVTRPLAAGDVTMQQAVAFLGAQLTIGLGVLLSLPHTWYCFQWGCAALPLVAIYPSTKRFFAYPQLFLGFTMNWGTIMGFAAVQGSVDPSIVLPLYGSGITWTLLYDTIYAHQDKEEDAKLQLHSTALAFGDDKNVLYGLATLTSLQWAAVGLQADLALVPYLTGIGASYLHLLWQVNTADLGNSHNLAERFRSNSTVGAIIFVALCAGTYFS